MQLLIMKLIKVVIHAASHYVAYNGLIHAASHYVAYKGLIYTASHYTTYKYCNPRTFSLCRLWRLESTQLLIM